MHFLGPQKVRIIHGHPDKAHNYGSSSVRIRVTDSFAKRMMERFAKDGEHIQMSTITAQRIQISNLSWPCLMGKFLL